MKALLCHEYGPPESLRLEETAAPTLSSMTSVRIAVTRVALNFPDLLMLEGKYQYRAPFPFALGMECAGRVVEVGPAVTAVAPGDRVAAHPWVGCLAEEVVAEEDDVFRLPDAMDDDVASGFPIAGGTVWHALVDRGEIAPGETALILGAAGGVGIPAIEVAKAEGARVIAAARGADKLALTRAHGADETVDYAAEDLVARVRELTDGKGADVIYDTVGGDFTDQAMRAINWGGRLLVIGFAAGRIAQVPANRVLLKGASVVGVAYQAFRYRDPEGARSNMAALFQAWSDGRIRPHISHRFPLERTAEALRAMEARAAQGKIVIEVA